MQLSPQWGPTWSYTRLGVAGSGGIRGLEGISPPAVRKIEESSSELPILYILSVMGRSYDRYTDNKPCFEHPPLSSFRSLRPCVFV